MGYFWRRPRLRFIVGLVGLVGFWGTSRVGKGVSSSSNSAVVFGLSGLIDISSLSSLVVTSSLSSLIL